MIPRFKVIWKCPGGDVEKDIDTLIEEEVQRRVADKIAELTPMIERLTEQANRPRGRPRSKHRPRDILLRFVKIRHAEPALTDKAARLKLLKQITEEAGGEVEERAVRLWIEEELGPSAARPRKLK